MQAKLNRSKSFDLAKSLAVLTQLFLHEKKTNMIGGFT